MLRVSGSDVVPASGAEALGASTVFLADPVLAEDRALPDRVAAALKGGRGIAWVPDGGRVVGLPLDDGGRTTHDLALPTGRTIAAGSHVDTADPRALTIEGGVTVGLQGEETAVLSYDGAPPQQAWIRYFYARDKTTLDGIRFRIFGAGAPGGQAAVRLDLARPFDPARSRVSATTATSFPSTFRTRWGAVIELATRPLESHWVYAWDPALEAAYLTLNGIWDWLVAGAPPTDPIDLIPGTSGTEYVRAAPDFVLSFVAGAPAFAAQYDPAPPPASAQSSVFPLVKTAPDGSVVTTAWVYAQPAPDDGPVGVTADFYSQPARAALFVPDGGSGFMNGYDLRAAPLPPDATTVDAPAASFPAAPYGGLDVPQGAGDDEWLANVKRFETQVLTPARTQAIDDLKPAGRLALPSGASGPTTAVTPQGLLSTFSSQGADWDSLVLAQASGGRQLLQYRNITGKLREALLAQQPFLVVSDVAKLMSYCTTTYCLTQETLALAAAAKVPSQALKLVQPMLGRIFQSGDAFGAALDQLLGADYAQYAPTIQKYAELAEVAIGGWTFDLAAWRWATGENPTILVFHFADGGFKDLVDDRTRWTLPDEFNANAKQVQDQLNAIIADAESRAGSEPDLKPFVDTVLAGGDRKWNGVLYLNVAVPASNFPPALEGLAAGLSSPDLRAHHLGVTLSAFDVQDEQVALADSALFGLILYDDRTDLVYKGDAYEFKVLSLKVLFANATIIAFSSQIELLVGRLFAELASLPEYGAHGPNNIVIDGTLQDGAYRFVSTTSSKFAITSEVVDFVTVNRAQFVTLVDKTTASRVAAQFVLEGEMGFARLGDFDLFGFGASKVPGDSGSLGFSNLLVAMDFDPNDPKASRTLTFVAGQMAFDPARSSARAKSLPARFPLQATAMREGQPATATSGDVAKSATPADLGFIPVESPLTPGSLGPAWYGLELSLSFGAPGALAPKLGFTGALLASWAPTDKGYDVAVGLRLPGSTGGRKALTIMGPLKLTIGQLNFLYDPDTSGYLLELQRMALSFLGLSFPPGGQTNAVLFGDPDPNGSNTTLGWYVAYKKDDEKKDDEKKDDEKKDSADTGEAMAWLTR